MSKQASLKLVNILLERPESERPLLNDVNLDAIGGQFIAIVGPSGCGKSTLLKVIAGVLNPGDGQLLWRGEDLLNESDLDPQDLGYVPQFSIAYDLLTVEECIENSIKMRVAGLSGEEIDERIDKVLGDVGLLDIADRRVSVLSGGQKRRLALAMELVSEPPLLLCDEVTSGLDPKSEDEIVTLLQKLSREGNRIVLSVTHSLRQLDQYDAVIVLNAGRLVYHGPSNLLLHYFNVTQVEDVFSRIGQKDPERWSESWAKHQPTYYRELFKEKTEGRGETSEDDDRIGEGTPGAFSQMLTLTKRRFKLFLRDPGQVWLQLAMMLGFPCLVVIFALNGLPQVKNLSTGLDVGVVRQMQEGAVFQADAAKVGTLVSGIVMFQVILLTLMASNNSAREIAGERLIFEKEKMAGLSPFSYLVSKVIFLMILVGVQSIWMGLFVRAVCTIPGELSQQLTFLVLVNGAMTATCLGISSMASSPEQSSLLSIYLVGFQLPLSGAMLALPESLGMITRPFIAAYWSWSGYLKSLMSTRYYDVVTAMTETVLSDGMLCTLMLLIHVLAGFGLAFIGIKRSRWD